MQKIEKWQIDAGLCSGKGRVRKLQEDAWYFSYEKADPADMDFISKSFCATTDSGGCAFAVFDGTGEGEYGREAACTAADWMKYLVRLSDRGMDLEKTLPAWSSIVNQKIRRDFPGAGTTMALAFFSGPTVQLAYIGDCRVYRFRAGQLEQQTRDHTQAELMKQLSTRYATRFIVITVWKTK